MTIRRVKYHGDRPIPNLVPSATTRAFIRHPAIIAAVRVLVAETEEINASKISDVALGVRGGRNIRRSADDVVLTPVCSTVPPAGRLLRWNERFHGFERHDMCDRHVLCCVPVICAIFVIVCATSQPWSFGYAGYAGA